MVMLNKYKDFVRTDVSEQNSCNWLIGKRRRTENESALKTVNTLTQKSNAQRVRFATSYIKTVTVFRDTPTHTDREIKAKVLN